MADRSKAEATPPRFSCLTYDSRAVREEEGGAAWPCTLVAFWVAISWRRGGVGVSQVAFEGSSNGGIWIGWRKSMHVVAAVSVSVCSSFEVIFGPCELIVFIFGGDGGKAVGSCLCDCGAGCGRSCSM